MSPCQLTEHQARVPPRGPVVPQGQLTPEPSGHGQQSRECQSSRTRASSPCPAAGRTALSPTCGCQLDGTGERGQLLSSHPQWDQVSVGVVWGQRAQILVSLSSPGPWAKPLRSHRAGCWLGSRGPQKLCSLDSKQYGGGRAKNNNGELPAPYPLRKGG